MELLGHTPSEEQSDSQQEQPRFVEGESGLVYETTKVPDEHLGTADHLVNS